VETARRYRGTPKGIGNSRDMGRIPSPGRSDALLIEVGVTARKYLKPIHSRISVWFGAGRARDSVRRLPSHPVLRLRSPTMVKSPVHLLCAGVVFAAVVSTAAAVPVTAPAAADYRKTIEPMLVRYCYDCHGDGVAKGQVAFDELDTDAKVISSHDLWFKVLKN